METAIILAALLSTTAISLAPNLILLLSPNFAESSASTAGSSLFLSAGQALAAGALLGDVFLHTLPHCLSGKEEDDILKMGILILCGFAIFLVLDMLVRYGNGDSSHDHGHHSEPTKKKVQEEQASFSFSPMVILNLAGDALHNFTDGLAIGASFASTTHLLVDGSLSTQVLTQMKSHGGLASLAVLFHEIPHELGDFAVLVSGGMSKMQAIQAQFLTAIAAYCGTVVGLFAATWLEHSMGYDVMLPLTAGGFIYLATVTILPEVLNSDGKISSNLGQRQVQILAFGIGVAFMYVVATLEHHDHGGGHAHHHHDHDHHSHGHHSHGHHHHDHHDHGHDHHNSEESLVPKIFKKLTAKLKKGNNEDL